MAGHTDRQTDRQMYMDFNLTGLWAWRLGETANHNERNSLKSARDAKSFLSGNVYDVYVVLHPK